MLSNYLEEIHGNNVGVIVNFFSKQMLNRQFNVYDIPTANYVDYLTLNNLKTIFIDNEIFETDHKWYKRELNGLIANAKFSNIKVIIIKNTSKKLLNTYLDFSVLELSLDDHISQDLNKINLPLLVDETQFNPISKNIKYDILYLSDSKVYRSEGIQALHVNIKPVREEFILDEMTRSKLYLLLEMIKQSKCLYIYNADRIDPVILRFIEVISLLQNTLVLYSCEDIKSPYSINDEDVNIVNKIVVLIKDKMSRERHSLPLQRKAFMNNTFVNSQNLVDKDYIIPISVITSTNRKNNLKQYIKSINMQENVKLQIILVTHGFELNEEEQDHIFASLNKNIELEIIPLNEEQPLGYCLNTAIKRAKYDYIAKMDDDDFYFEHYLIGSWLAAKYSNADLVGKLATYSYLEDAKLIISKHKNMNRKYNNFVMGATFFCKSEIMKKYMFSYVRTGEDSDFLRRINEDNVVIYINDPYNFCIYRSGDIGNHTWKISDLEYMKNSEIVSFDSPYNVLSF